MKRFKALTTGHTVIMGRKTFDSLPKGALPNRRNIVLSRQDGLVCAGAECFTSLEEALAHCNAEEEIFIMGGASVYKEALPLTHRLYITLVHDTGKQADAFFPEIDEKYGKKQVEKTIIPMRNISTLIASSTTNEDKTKY